MTLSRENLVYYLLERGLITRETVVNGGLEISEIPRRNRNFKVKRRHGPGHFLKQPRRWDPESLRTLQAEAQCYRLAGEDGALSALAPIVPRFHSFDRRRTVLVTELLDGAETVAEHHFRNSSFPVAVAEQLGRVFGAYHRKPVVDPAAIPEDLFPRRLPWALTLHQMSPEKMTDISGGIYQMVSMLRQFPQFGAALDQVRSGWRPDALIHSDIKWDNCVLCPDGSGGPRLRIVDWEMADWGDSAWDIAGIFSAYLSFWVQSLPAAHIGNTTALVAQAGFPIEWMRPAIRAFWTTYGESREVSGDAARDLLRRVVRYAGARNIQTAFEVLQKAPQANANTVMLLQLSMNVMSEPETAARELLGIEP